MNDNAFMLASIGSVVVVMLRRVLSRRTSFVPGETKRRVKTSGRDLVLREICPEDFDRKILDLLAQLTTVGNVPKEFFIKRCEVMRADPRQRILVVEDRKRNVIVATGALCVEPKFIHQAGLAGHIEDVVVDKDMRSQGLGSEVVRELLRLARGYGCYKAILDCKTHNITFYEKLGFKRKEVQMALYFPSTETKDEKNLIEMMNNFEPQKCGEDLVVRHLCFQDLSSKGGFLELLSQLTKVGHISPSFLKVRLEELINSNRELMFVIEDVSTRRVVAAATLLLEYKFIHNAGKCGHIEDVVVDGNVRGRGLGKKIVSAVRDAAKALGCYKCILDCSESNVRFYEKCGFRRNETCMAIYFK